MTYAAWSTFVTDDLRKVRLDPEVEQSHAFAVADTRDPGRVGLEVWAPRLRAELSAGTTPAEVVARTDRVASPPLAEWTQQGAVIGLQGRSEEHTSELRSLMRISYAVFCLKKKKNN